MSTILKELRLIQAKHNSGALSLAEFERAKSALLNGVPDALAPEVSEPRVVREATPMWDMFYLRCGIAVVCAGVTLAVTRNFSIAATVGITVLAAFTIKLFTALE